jgi:hypothetical protein
MIHSRPSVQVVLRDSPRHCAAEIRVKTAPAAAVAFEGEPKIPSLTPQRKTLLDFTPLRMSPASAGDASMKITQVLHATARDNRWRFDNRVTMVFIFGNFGQNLLKFDPDGHNLGTVSERKRICQENNLYREYRYLTKMLQLETTITEKNRLYGTPSLLGHPPTHSQIPTPFEYVPTGRS